MKKIELNNLEHDYLGNSSFLSLKWKEILRSTSQQNNTYYIIMITEDQADELRDLFGEQLQLVGFDENYKLTKEGEILESLIDKFYCE